MEESKDLKVDIDEQLAQMKELIHKTEQTEKDMQKIEKSNKRPVQNMLQALIQTACYPFKTELLDQILERWYKSAKWNSRASYFVKDKLNENLSYLVANKKEEHMEIDEGCRKVGVEQYLWTIQTAQDLLKEAQNNKEIYYDLKRFNEVKEKIIIIEGLKKYLDLVLQKKHDMKVIKEYLKELKEIENVDFVEEIERTQKKLRVLQDVQQTVEKELSKNDQKHPINLDLEMIMMLKAKVKIAQDLKKEFYDVLKQNQDTFSKQMLQDLKRIISKANKEHSLEMKQEQQILANVSASEEWFLATYEKLKKSAGKSLNQVDFKDFIQLSTVVHEEKEVENLLKSKMLPEQLVGAAQNLWQSLFGVKWLLELRQLIQQSQDGPVEMKKVQELDEKAQAIKIDYAKEIAKENIYERHFKEFAQLVDSINMFIRQFGDKEKVVQCLDEKYELNQKDEGVFDQFLKEVQHLTEVLQNHKSGELEILSKIHTWIEFLREYKQLANEYQNKIPFEKAMLLSQQAREKGLPEEISALKELNERVNRFEKFNREYHDYKRFRDRIKKQGFSLSAGIVDVRFTALFLRKLIQESKNLSIDKDLTDDFDEYLLEQDLLAYDQWRNLSTDLLHTLEEDEESLKNPDLRAQFTTLKNQMKKLPVYDKNLFMKVQAFDWLFSVLDMLEIKDEEEHLSIGTWEGKSKQADQFTGTSLDVKSHSIYQRLLWEIQQSRSVIEFVYLQKNNQKSLAAKFNQDKQQNYAFFRNKHSRQKLQKMLDIAKQSKVDITEEIRCLDQWIKDYDKYTQLYKEGKLVSEYQFDKLRDIAKQMYLSPIDYGEIFFSLKDKLDTAEMIKLNLKKIFQEYDYQVQQKVKDSQQVKRLKLSRISFDLKLYHKSCNITGIKEIDYAIDKVQRSKKKLQDARDIIASITESDLETQINEIKQKLEDAKKRFAEVEIDMENEELEVRRLIFEAELKIIFGYPQGMRKIQYEEFKDFDKEYDKLRNLMRDDKIHAKFLEIKEKVQVLVRQINKLENKQQLSDMEKKVEEECPMIDFNQLLTDKDAHIQLGKRTKRDSDKNLDVDSDLEEEKIGNLHASSKRLKQSDKKSLDSYALSQVQEEKDVEQSSSSSQNESVSDSSSDSSDGSDSSESSSSEESEEEGINIAKNRSRRNIVPTMNADFIYEKSSVNKVRQIQEEQKKEKEDSEESEEEDEEEKKKKELERKKERKIARKKKRAQKRKEIEKKKEMQKQLREYRLSQNKTQSTIQQRQKLQNRFDPDQPLAISTLIASDKGLQDSLQIMKTRIREQSRQKIKETIDQTSPVFSSLQSDQKRELLVDLETEIFNKHPEVDHFYRKKTSDACENIKFLSNYKDIAELFAKKNIQFTRLLQPHHQFKDNVVKIDKGLKERKQQLKLQQKQQQQQEREENLREEDNKLTENDVAVSQDQSMMKVLYSGTTSIEQQKLYNEFSHKIKTNESDDDLESLDSNPALFSDEEDNNVIQQQQQHNQYDPYQLKHNTQFTGQPMHGEYGNQVQNFPQVVMPQRLVQYNPYEIIEQRYSRYIQKKSSEPIMYDPVKDKSQLTGQSQKDKNMAPFGSLLKVWEGQLEISKEQQPSCQFFSTQDIQVFQLLPEIPHILPLKGKAKIADVTSHFLRLRKEKKLVKGWITRKGALGNLSGSVSGTSNWQDNSDKYTKLFDELESTDKAALFNVFQGLTFYLVPITAKTKEFCKQMGIIPEPTVLDPQLQLSNQIFDIETQLSDETHCFAILSQIKQSFTNKLNFLNPEVLREAPVQIAATGKRDKSFSPITSDEEENPKDRHKQQILQSVKTEEYGQQQVQVQPNMMVKQDEQMRGPQPTMALIKQSEDDDDDVDIDELIMKFRTQKFDINSIQAKLMPIIHKVKGEKEIKLTQFLQELISKYNNPQPQSQPLIKQETDQIPQSQSIPYGQGRPQQFMQQQPGYPMNQPPRYQGQSPQGQFMPQPNQQQFRQMPPQSSFSQVGQQQLRPPQTQQPIGAVYPQMNMHFQRQNFPPQMQQQQQMFQQQSGVGLPPLRPPPGGQMQGNQMIRPNQGGMMPQQQFGNMPPRMTGPPYQQQQQVRQPNQNQQQQKR